MQHLERLTLSKFLIQRLHATPGQNDLVALLIDVADAVKRIAALAVRGALAGTLGAARSENHQGEAQQKLDVLAHDIMVEHGVRCGRVAGMASEELESPCELPAACARGRYLLLFDPLDGSSNIDVNVSVGTIFSVLARLGAGELEEQDFLRPGREQVAAGYAIYGPSTMLVLSVGQGVHGFTLDHASDEFILTHADMQVPEETSEFAINASNERFWEAPVARYVTECKAGRVGVRGRDFNLRWIASMVAEVHRILVRGGIFMYPQDRKQPIKPGRLRLMYEANPMGMLIEQAGGLASTGRARILDLMPAELHQRVPVLLGSRHEIERIERYHAEHDRSGDAFVSPLFNERSLYRPEFTAGVHA